MKVVVDDKIPYIREALANMADEVIYAPGKDFTPQLVKDADALIIRTRTRCNRELLEGSRKTRRDATPPRWHNTCNPPSSCFSKKKTSGWQARRWELSA